MADRQAMVRSLKAVAVPALRDLGFRGSYPHFYRDRGGHVDLACFQFSQSGGRFVVELSFADPLRTNVYVNREVPVSELRVSQTTKRWRLGAAEPHADHWFAFSAPAVSAEEVALSVVGWLHRQGEPWWKAQHNAA